MTVSASSGFEDRSSYRGVRNRDGGDSASDRIVPVRIWSGVLGDVVRVRECETDKGFGGLGLSVAHSDTLSMVAP